MFLTCKRIIAELISQLRQKILPKTKKSFQTSSFKNSKKMRVSKKRKKQLLWFWIFNNNNINFTQSGLIGQNKPETETE